jgi:hypothetical protein
LRKEVLRAVRRRLTEAGGGASLRLVGGALISIDSWGAAENEGADKNFLPFFLWRKFFRSLYLEGEFVWRRVAMRRDENARSRVGLEEIQGRKTHRAMWPTVG